MTCRRCSRKMRQFRPRRRTVYVCGHCGKRQLPDNPAQVPGLIDGLLDALRRHERDRARIERAEALRLMGRKA